jgi:hypothetical protein
MLNTTTTHEPADGLHKPTEAHVFNALFELAADVEQRLAAADMDIKDRYERVEGVLNMLEFMDHDNEIDRRSVSYQASIDLADAAPKTFGTLAKIVQLGAWAAAPDLVVRYVQQLHTNLRTALVDQGHVDAMDALYPPQEPPAPPASHFLAERLGTEYEHPAVMSMYITLVDEVNELVDRLHHTSNEHLARALRDLVQHDLPIMFHQIEKDTRQHVLAEFDRHAGELKRDTAQQVIDDIERMAHAQREHGLEQGLHTAVKFEARRRKEIRVAKLPRRLRTRRA